MESEKDLNAQTMCVDALAIFLNITNNIDLEDEDVYPSTKTAISEMTSIARMHMDFLNG